MVSVIYEDKNFVALNKPAGLLTHPLRGRDESALTDWIIKHYPEAMSVGDDPENRPGIVHRLDKDTSGIILIARNNETFDYFKKLFQAHQVKKTYLALVHGRVSPKTGLVNQPIRLKKNSIRRTLHLGKNAKPAVTEYRVLKVLNSRPYKDYRSYMSGEEPAYFSLLEVTPQTGRTHQIRVHLKSIDHPVVGDKLYSFRSLQGAEALAASLGLKRQFLHAESLEFSLPGGRRMKLTADLPEDLQNFLNRLY